MASSKDKWVRRFFIAEVRRHKDGFTMYKVTSLIFLKKSPETASRISVWKRYNDFRKLYKSLDGLSRHSSIKEPFPPFPKPHFFGRFEREVVNQRRKSAIKLLEFIAKYSVLYTSEAFVKFLDSSVELDDSSHSCAHSITSCDTSSEDDHDSNYSNTDDNRKCPNDQSTTDIFVNNKDIRNTIAERHRINADQMQSSECEKHNNIMLNFNVETPVFESNIEKDGESVQDQMEDSVISNDVPSPKLDSSDYIIVAAAHMSAGHQHKLLGEYEEAYIQYGFGITHLQLGAKIDPDTVRQARVLDKIQKYISRADKLYKKYLQHNSSKLSKPATELENYKVLRVIGSVMLVKDTRLVDVKRVIKTVEKCAGVKEDIFHFVLRNKVPFMVDLHAYIQTESTIFLIIEYATGGSLWEFIKSHYGFKDEKSNNLCTKHSSSINCDNLFTENYSVFEDDVSPFNIMVNTDLSYTNDMGPSKESTDGSDACLDISTIQLMEQSQELLKSVDETLKKSNSMINNHENSTSKFIEVNTALRASTSHKINSSALSESGLKTKIPNASIYNECNNTLTSRDTTGTNEPQIKMSSKLNNCNECEPSDNNDTERGCKHWQVPETVVRQWGAELLLAIEALHEQDVIISNLRPDDLLIDQNGHIALSYVIPRRADEFTDLLMPYAAPELFSYLPHMSPEVAVDVWSFGVILYELLTGIPFQAIHPGLFRSHSIISIPPELTENAKHLLINILKSDARERLTIDQIKQHPFFENIDWEKLINP